MASFDHAVPELRRHYCCWIRPWGSITRIQPRRYAGLSSTIKCSSVTMRAFATFPIMPSYLLWEDPLIRFWRGPATRHCVYRFPRDTKQSVNDKSSLPQTRHTESQESEALSLQQKKMTIVQETAWKLAKNQLVAPLRPKINIAKSPLRSMRVCWRPSCFLGRCCVQSTQSARSYCHPLRSAVGLLHESIV